MEFSITVTQKSLEAWTLLGQIALYIWYCTDITQSQIDFEILIFESLRKVIHSVNTFAEITD